MSAVATLATAPTTTEAALPFLYIHIDLNKTLLLSDVVSDKSVDSVAVEIIAANAWGEVLPPEVADTAPKWLLHEPPHFSVDGPPEAHMRGLVTFAHFAKHILYPYETTTNAETTARNKAQKRKQQCAVHAFIDPSGPGAAFHNLGGIIRDSILLPKHEQGLLDQFLLSSTPDQFAFLRSGLRYLLPSYFALLSHLVHSKRRFRLFFRTFGSDLAAVVDEHNLFCAGLHPLYPASEAVVAAQLRVCCPQDTISIIRVGEVVVTATVEHGMVAQRSGYHAAHAELSRRDKRRVTAVLDDYSAWFHHHERSEFGKFFAFSPDDEAEHHMFFDDNIGEQSDTVRLLTADNVALLSSAVGPGISIQDASREAILHERRGDAAAAAAVAPLGDARIVCAIDSRTGAQIPYDAKCRNVFLVRADTLSALLNEDYFVQLVQMCEDNRASLNR